MPTNDERREVAARLREHIGKPLFTGQDVEDIIGVQRSDFDVILADASYRRLADLIEPKPERTCRDDGAGVFRCTRCGAFVKRDAVMDCTGQIPLRYCPNCGARVEVGE